MKSCWKDIVLRPDTKIIDAIKAIDATELQIALVADGDGRLRGTITDGDIRRAILHRVTPDEPVAEIMERAPLCMKADTARAERLEAMRKTGVRHIPLVDEHGRLVGLETLEELLQPEPRDEWVVIMAGGNGTRLKPLTDNTPKPMVDVGGGPFLEITIQRFAAQGFRRFFISVHHLADQIRDHFRDGRDFGVDIQYVEESRPTGTAGCLSRLPAQPDGPIVVTNGDILTATDVHHMVTYHCEHRPAATMGACEYATQIPFGVVQENDRRLEAIEEKPVKRYLVNAGIYVLAAEVLELLQPNERIDMPDLLIRAKESGGEVMVFPIRDYWMDIGRLNDFHRVNHDYANGFTGEREDLGPRRITGGVR